MFSLEKLKVYERALASVAGLAQLSANWDKRHAVVDQLLRASESVVLNLAEGARLRGGPQRQHMLTPRSGRLWSAPAAWMSPSARNWFAQPKHSERRRTSAKS